MKNNQNNNVIPFKIWGTEENKVWQILCERQLKNLEGRLSSLHTQGWKLLRMTPNNIPDFVETNKNLKDLTGWEIQMTDITYEDNTSWISSLANKKHRITNFIRTKKDLDYTSLPDIFHDVFGHIPFLTNPQYARIIEKFGRAMINPKNQKFQEEISRLGWYGYEFGLMQEEGKLVAFGTGLVSSSGELANAFSESVEKAPYDVEVVKETEISPHEFHKKLFVLESLDQLEKAIDKYL